MAVEPAAVVVPIYRLPASDAERRVLAQLSRVLHRHPRIAIVPESLDAASIAREYGLQVERFEDRHFTSVASYNRLMLDAAFYRRFERYGHILIHQLDAFVFRDELDHWCAQPYDYIGAPWMAMWPFTSPHKAWTKEPRGWLARRLLDAGGAGPMRYARINQVGNGGFSLRRVQAFLDVLRAPPGLIGRFREADIDLRQEDMFWGVAVNRWRERIRTPHWREALGFSIEVLPQRSLQFLGGRLPFGCHAWDRCDPEFWAPLLATAAAAGSVSRR